MAEGQAIDRKKYGAEYERIFGHAGAKMSGDPGGTARPAPLGTPSNPRKCGVAPPPYPRGFSYAHGQVINSWSEYNRLNRVMGMVDVGYPVPFPEKKPLPDSPIHGRHVED